ncbi:hypothetical protein F5879DRAFT_626744 [Lentinula edodes]|nr:hypothetical protein F5879DRAFT_626744 [Lentinula edodes]
MPTLFPSALLTNTYTNSSCNGTGLNWYINLVGETPCSTYERLHQICNPPFQVGVMTPPTNPASPPDTCMDQVADCCCNSVAFGLSMLCLNCQQGIGSSGNGINAGLGEYQLYLQGSRPVGQRCFPNVNQSLPTTTDHAVCNKGIKIIDDLYARLWWPTGDW